MRYILAGPDIGARVTDLDGLMTELGADVGLSASRAAESETVVQAKSDPLRLVRLAEPGDEGLTFSDLLRMLPQHGEPPPPEPPAPRFGVPEPEREDDDDEEEAHPDDKRAVTLPLNPAERTVLSALKDRADEPISMGEAVDLMVQAHQSGEQSFWQVEGEICIRVPARMIIAGVTSQAEAEEAVAAVLRDVGELVTPSGKPFAALWNPKEAIDTAIKAINEALTPKDAGWDFTPEATQKLPQSRMRALAQRLITDKLLALRAKSDRDLARTIANLLSDR